MKNDESQLDTRTCLLFSIATITNEMDEKSKLMQQAVKMDGNMTCSAMAYVNFVLKLK